MSQKEFDTAARLKEEGLKEFLQKGFRGASIRNIVKQSEVTTGAFYFYFKDKESLFREIVEPVLSGLIELYSNALSGFNEFPDEQKQDKMHDYAQNGFGDFIGYIYEHWEVFKLLTTCAEGSGYDNFIHRFVELDVENNVKYLNAIGNSAIKAGRINKEFLHMISSAFFSGLFEIVEHDMKREDAEVYIENMNRFFVSGWNTAFDS